jgi:hypothetical protein
MTSEVLELPVAFRDACAADLRLHLGLPPQVALATRRVCGEGWTAELRILGASHQVLIRQGERIACSETVACHLADEGRPLDAIPRRGPEGSDYEFRATTVHLSPGDFRGYAEDVLSKHVDDPRALCARFPGDELSATALCLDPGAGQDGAWLSWQTWHTYPRTGEVVATASRTALRAGSSLGRT